MQIKLYLVGISLIVLLNSSLCHVFGNTQINCNRAEWQILDKKTRITVTLYQEAETQENTYCFSEESNNDNKYLLMVRLNYLKDAKLKAIKSKDMLEKVTPFWQQLSNNCKYQDDKNAAEEWIIYTDDNLQSANKLITKLNTCISNINQSLESKEVVEEVVEESELNSCQEKQITIINESLEKIKIRYDEIELDSLEESCNLEKYEYALEMNDLADSKKIYNATILEIRNLNILSLALSKIALSVIDLQLKCNKILLNDECSINDNHCKITEDDLTQESLDIPIKRIKKCIIRLKGIQKKSIIKIQSFSETLTM